MKMDIGNFYRFLVVVAVVAAVLLFSGCGGGLFGPDTVNAGYYIENKPDSKTTVLIGTNNSQANAIHAGVGGAAGAAEGERAEADDNARTAKSSGLFVNNAVGDRSADVDATTALEMLRNVRGVSAGQAQTQSKGDSSPSTSSQNQTPSNTESPTLALPVSVGQTAPSATAAANQPQDKEQAKPGAGE